MCCGCNIHLGTGGTIVPLVPGVETSRRFANPISSVQLFNTTTSTLRNLAAESHRRAKMAAHAGESRVEKMDVLWMQYALRDRWHHCATGPGVEIPRRFANPISSVQFSCSILPYQPLGTWSQSPIGEPNGPRTQARVELRANPDTHRRVT